MGKIVRFYQTEDGKTPFKDFLDTLPTTYFKKLVGSDDIWECRVQFGSNDYRILCFHAGGSVLVLTHGFMKKTQKTPAKEIERAETCKRDYLRRHKRHE
jgi:phage-related protein